jgi:hypothetical protein
MSARRGGRRRPPLDMKFDDGGDRCDDDSGGDGDKRDACTCAAAADGDEATFVR